ncbi:ABC transporter permease subunit [Halosimplex sp. J119]
MTATASEVEDLTRERTLTERVLGQREFGVVLAVLALSVIGAFVRADVFLTLSNVTGVLRNAAVVTIIGYGMTMLITAGEFDLSVGSMMGLGGALLTVMRIEGYSVVFIFVVVTLFAVVYGIAQGLLVTKLGLPSLIVTIGTLTLMQGATLIVLDNVTQAIPSQEYTPLLTAFGATLNLPFDVLIPFTDVTLLTIPVIEYAVPVVHSETQAFTSVPVQIFWMLAIGVVFHYLLFYTRFGYRTKATGGDERSARYTGIDTDQIKIANFAIVAVLAVFAGMSQVAFTGNASPTTGSGLELIVIASVVIGGSDLFGGEGTMVGTVLGALVFSLTQNILVLAGMGTQLFSVLTGAFIIFAVGIDALTRHTGGGVLDEKLIEPFRWIVRDPRGFYRHVGEEIQGITPAITFASLVAVVWSIPLLAAVTLSFAGSSVFGAPLIPFEFSLFIVGSGVGSFGTVPVLAFVSVGGVYLLSVVFLHAITRALGGTGTLDETVQIVGFALAPTAICFVPAALYGFHFLTVLVAITALPVVLGVGLLWYYGTSELHGLSRGRSAAAVLGVALLWLVTAAAMASQLAAASAG